MTLFVYTWIYNVHIRFLLPNKKWEAADVFFFRFINLFSKMFAIQKIFVYLLM